MLNQCKSVCWVSNWQSVSHTHTLQAADSSAQPTARKINNLQLVFLSNTLHAASHSETHTSLSYLMPICWYPATNTDFHWQSCGLHKKFKAQRLNSRKAILENSTKCLYYFHKWTCFKYFKRPTVKTITCKRCCSYTGNSRMSNLNESESVCTWQVKAGYAWEWLSNKLVINMKWWIMHKQAWWKRLSSNSVSCWLNW